MQEHKQEHIQRQKQHLQKEEYKQEIQGIFDAKKATFEAQVS